MNIGLKIDSYYTLRAKRLELEKSVDSLKQEEADMKADIIAELHESSLNGAKGAIATASVTHKTKPKVTDWELVYDYIKETGNVELLHKRLTEGLWASMQEDGIEIPGVEPMVLTDLSLTRSTR